jgi:hypothetical protein
MSYRTVGFSGGLERQHGAIFVLGPFGVAVAHYRLPAFAVFQSTDRSMFGSRLYFDGHGTGDRPSHCVFVTASSAQPPIN